MEKSEAPCWSKQTRVGGNEDRSLTKKEIKYVRDKRGGPRGRRKSPSYERT
jgi:hypothetical protein